MNTRLTAQSVVEYGLLVAAVVLLVLLGGYALGGAVHEWFEMLSNHILAATPH